MEKVEYDLDTSGGLMEEIQALIAPPVSDEQKRRLARNEREPQKRFGGRTVNRDCCDSCSEGGDLLCCDRCPASFHFNCCDPPLEEDDIPTGDWICNECKSAMKEVSLIEDSNLSGIVNTSACPSPSSEASNISSQPAVVANPFSKLVDTFKNRNPREFNLPNELENFTVFPGDRKRKADEKGCSIKYTCKRDDEDLPDRFCFQCSRLSKCSDLLFCDFCPLAFHPDCLNPPLTMPPTALWLCPCHPEHFEPALQDPRYSRRCQIIEDIRGVICQQAVKMNFINKAKRLRILNNRKANQRRRRMTVVPNSIKDQYRNPPALSVPSFIREMQQQLPGHHHPITPASQPEKEEWLKFLIRFHCDLAADLSKVRSPSPSITGSSPVDSTLGNTKKNGTSVVKDNKPISLGSTTKQIQSNERTSSSSPKVAPENVIESKEPTNVVPHPPTTSVATSKPLTSSSNPKIIILATQSSSATSKMPPETTSTTCSSAKPSEMLSTKTSLTPSSVKSVVATSAASASSGTGGSHIVSNVTADTLQDPTLSQLDDRLVRVLAFQRLQQLLGHTKVPAEAQAQPESNAIMKRPISKLPVNDAPADEAIAVLSPMTGTGKTCRMTNRTVSIGAGRDNDICLSHIGHCNFITGKHACIFFDQETRQFELLNYSEHGTIVDNVLYSCDFSLLKTANGKEVVSSSAKFPETSSKFFNVNRRGKSGPRGRFTVGLSADVIKQPCRCRSSGSSMIGSGGAGWEGTAVLHHGSYLKFGCLHFVFSIVDCATEKPPRSQSANTVL